MRRILFMGLILIAGACCALSSEAQTRPVLTGDYVEARTASVFAGACHYNGEYVTTGRDAVLALNIRNGQWKGVDLSGVRAVVAVSADDNLSGTQIIRHSEIVVDSATAEQAEALVEALKAKDGRSLGEVVAVRRAPVTFKHERGAYTVEAPGFAALSVRGMPNNECCRMPNMVWYAPLVPLSNRRVGYTMKAYYAGGPIGDMWQRANENSAFYGSFSL